MAGIGVLVTSYPKLSETFIAQEIRLLEEYGFPVEVFVRHASGETRTQSIVDEIVAPVVYLPRLPGGIRAFASGNLRAFTRQPLRYLGALGAALGRSVQLRDGTLWRFFEAGWLVGTRRIGRDGVTHLHAHFFQRTTRVAEQAARIAGVRFTVSAHAYDIYTQPPAVVRRLGAAADAVLTCTAANVRHLVQAIGLDPAKVHLVFHGVDTTRFQPRAAPVPGVAGTEDAPRFVTVGRLVPKKGLDDVLRALAKLACDFRFDIYGEGPLRGELEALVRELGLEGQVRLHGAVLQEELVPALRASAVYLCGSRETEDGNRDGIPNTVAEAMAVALPVIATRVSGIPELVEDEVTGLLVEANDPAAFATALNRLVADPEESERFGRAGRKRVEEVFETRTCFAACARLLERYR